MFCDVSFVEKDLLRRVHRRNTQVIQRREVHVFRGLDGLVVQGRQVQPAEVRSRARRAGRGGRGGGGGGHGHHLRGTWRAVLDLVLWILRDSHQVLRGGPWPEVPPSPG